MTRRKITLMTSTKLAADYRQVEIHQILRRRGAIDLYSNQPPWEGRKVYTWYLTLEPDYQAFEKCFGISIGSIKLSEFNKPMLRVGRDLHTLEKPVTLNFRVLMQTSWIALLTFDYDEMAII